ncbi:Uncharacterised protein [Vibrio cholerae]|nr:Uncharacterised protein [Vibrio cholerae]
MSRSEPSPNCCRLEWCWSSYRSNPSPLLVGAPRRYNLWMLLQIRDAVPFRHSDAYLRLARKRALTQTC